MTQTESEYTATLLKRQIRESQRVAALTMAAADVQVINISTDPQGIAAMLEESLRDAPPDAVVRVGRAAEARLAQLASEESKDTGSPGAAFAAHVQVQDRMRRFRGQLPEVRREQIHARHTARAAALRNSVLAGARMFHIENLLAAADRAATKPAA